MGLAMSKFLNTVTHFSVSEFVSLLITLIGPGIQRFSALTGDTQASGTETDFNVPINGNIRIVRMLVKANINSMDASTVVSFRDDGVSVVSVTVPAGITTVVDSGAISVDVASGSLCNLLYDTMLSTVGNWDNVSVVIQYQRVLN